MKWGVRRYENPDGTLTEAGKARYSKKQKKEEEDKFYEDKYNRIKNWTAKQRDRLYKTRWNPDTSTYEVNSLMKKRMENDLMYKDRFKRLDKLDKEAEKLRKSYVKGSAFVSDFLFATEAASVLLNKNKSSQEKGKDLVNTIIAGGIVHVTTNVLRKIEQVSYRNNYKNWKEPQDMDTGLFDFGRDLRRN